MAEIISGQDRTGVIWVCNPDEWEAATRMGREPESIPWSGWQASQPGDREVRRQLRLVLNRNGLPPQGDLFDRAYAYIREHY